MDGPRDPSFWLYGEEKPGHVSNRTFPKLHDYKCPKCGRVARASKPPMCRRCNCMMR